MLTEEMKLLVTQNMGLAGYTVKQFLSTGIDYEELCSLAYLGLVKAAKSFKAEKATFATYAVRVMRNEILMFLRGQKKHSQCVSYDAMTYQEDGENNTFLCLFGREDPELERVENIGLYDFLTEDLSEREKQVVDLVIVGEVSTTDTGRRLGISQSYVSRIRRMTERKMREKMTPQLCQAARPKTQKHSCAL